MVHLDMAPRNSILNLHKFEFRKKVSTDIRYLNKEPEKYSFYRTKEYNFYFKKYKVYNCQENINRDKKKNILISLIFQSWVINKWYLTYYFLLLFNVLYKLTYNI